jgi:tRNA 2-thiouridine synthesizing protein A
MKMLEVDTSGLACPMPVLKAHKTLGQMQKDEVLKLITTDSDSCTDVPVFVKSTNNELVLQTSEAGKFVFIIRKN